MAKTKGKLKATLIGRLETPMIVAKPFIKKNGCWIRVVRDPTTDKYPLLTSIGKVVKGERRAPTVLRGYRGFVKISCVGFKKELLLSMLNDFLLKNFLGSYISDGFGRVKWLECEISEYLSNTAPFKKKFKIRKGLGTNYSKELKQLLIALMLHDFVDTNLHQSKIYLPITIEDEEIRHACVNHHKREASSNKLLSLVKYYDAFASMISRRKKFSANSRYDKEKGAINFKKLVSDLEQNQRSVYKLYNYIYQSKDLSKIVESMRFGQNSLRNHLLVMVNLAINDYYDKKLKIEEGIISISASKREELSAVKDAEMHSITPMSNADSQSSFNSMKEKARNIGSS
ncbi:MAG: hypothetical protein ACTSSK_01820 [Candidatus Heimdallarchaeota archaeon]